MIKLTETAFIRPECLSQWIWFIAVPFGIAMVLIPVLFRFGDRVRSKERRRYYFLGAAICFWGPLFHGVPFTGPTTMLGVVLEWFGWVLYGPLFLLPDFFA